MPTRFRPSLSGNNFASPPLRLLLLGSLLLVGSLGVCCWVIPAWAQQGTDSQQGRQLSLRDQLILGLRARSKADEAFIDKVVWKVKKGQLPRSLVDSTFLWAREKAESKSETRRLRPMVYFRPALTLRAKQLGISLDKPGHPIPVS